MDTIVFDLDDVLVKDAFFGVLKEFVKTFFEKELTKEDVGHEYYYENAVFGNDIESIKKFHEYFLQRNMYEYGVIEEGAIELLRELSKTHNVIIFTSSILESEKDTSASAILFKNKFEFLCKTFPFIPASNFILGRNKSIICSKYMVDDRVDNLTGNSEVKMLYTAQHNLDISNKELFEKGIFRVSSMDEIRKVIYGDFTNAEIFKIAHEYLPYAGENITCEKIRSTLDSTGKAIVEIGFKSNKYPDDNKKKSLETFLSNRFGMQVSVDRTKYIS